MSETPMCRCRWCRLPHWSVPALAAGLVVMVLALIGGGNYAWPVDAAVYLAVAAMTYAVLSGPVTRWRWRHEDRLYSEQGR